MKFRKSLWQIIAVLLAVTLSSCNLGATPAPTQDVGAIQTQAFNLVLTQVALQSSPTPLPTNTAQPTLTLPPPPTFAPVSGNGTNTPFPFNTPLAGFAVTPLPSPVPTLSSDPSLFPTKNGCNDGWYVGETAPKDGTKLEVFKDFSKGWTIINKGTCDWDEGYVFDYLQDYPGTTPELKGYDIAITKSDPVTKPNQSQSFIVKLTVPGGKIDYEYVGFWKLKDDAGNYFGPLVSVRIVAVRINP